MSPRSRAGLGLLLMLTILLSGCGSSGNNDEGLDTSTDSQPATELANPLADQSTEPQGPARVSTAETSLGTVLVSADGLTLYILTKDLTNTPSCYGDCILSWPPLLTDGNPEAGEGIDSSQLGVATRHDGTFQATYFGWPLYLFRGDTAPGDTRGHGSENLWQVLLPTGELLDEASEGTLGDAPSGTVDEEYNPDDIY